jgi:hypothetical protein
LFTCWEHVGLHKIGKLLISLMSIRISSCMILFLRMSTFIILLRNYTLKMDREWFSYHFHSHTLIIYLLLGPLKYNNIIPIPFTTMKASLLQIYQILLLLNKIRFKIVKNYMNSQFLFIEMDEKLKLKCWTYSLL